jgi:Fe-S-cluster containining protein
MKGSVCTRHGCSHCCQITEMELTRSDIERIEAAGHVGFYEHVADEPRLLLVKDQCFFLKDGKCRIYTIRPKGCRLYPLAMEMPAFTPTLDDQCPYRSEFKIDPDDVLELAELVKELGGSL